MTRSDLINSIGVGSRLSTKALHASRALISSLSGNGGIIIGDGDHVGIDQFDNESGVSDGNDEDGSTDGADDTDGESSSTTSSTEEHIDHSSTEKNEKKM